MFDGTAFCPACGAARRPVEAAGSTTPCPACRHALSQLAVDAVTMLECSGCDGVWLDAAAFEQICASTESRAALLHRAARPSQTPGQRVKYRPCVRCGKMMNRVNFGRHSGTIVDVCRGHGTFLDAGELHAIITFIQGGGLDRMREHDLEEMRDEQRRLAAAQSPSTRALANGDRRAAAWDAASLSEMIRALFGR